jgi:hypothetical protein
LFARESFSALLFRAIAHGALPFGRVACRELSTGLFDFAFLLLLPRLEFRQSRLLCLQLLLSFDLFRIRPHSRRTGGERNALCGQRRRAGGRGGRTLSGRLWLFDYSGRSRLRGLGTRRLTAGLGYFPCRDLGLWPAPQKREIRARTKHRYQRNTCY